MHQGHLLENKLRHFRINGSVLLSIWEDLLKRRRRQKCIGGFNKEQIVLTANLLLPAPTTLPSGVQLLEFLLSNQRGRMTI